MKSRVNKAQAFMEYAVFIVVLAAAFMAVRVVFLRAVQQKYRQAAETFGTDQYERGVTRDTEIAD